MKKTYLLLTFCITCWTSINAQQPRIGAEIKALLRKEGYTISTEQYADLSEGETAYYYRNFYSGTTYGIVAYSEASGVLDIDIYLYDDDGSLLVKDTNNDKMAIIEYSPYVTRRMKVVIKNYNSLSPVYEYRCKFIIAYIR